MNTTIIFIIFTKSLLFIFLRIVGIWIMARSLWRVYKESRGCFFLKTTKLQQRQQQHRLSLSTPTSTSCWSQKFSSLIQNRAYFGHYQQQEGEEENTSISSSSSSVVDDRNATADAVDGILLGRIIPRSYLDYTKTKPYQRRAENELHWKDLVEQYIIKKRNKDNELFRNVNHPKEEEDSEKEEDQVVVLDIKFETTVLLEGGEQVDSNNNNNNKQSSSPIINVQLRMQRQPNETANRTLRRMELSIQRKIIQGYRYGSSMGGQRSGIHVVRESSIASNNNDTNDFAPTSRIMINNMGGGSGTSVQNQSYVGENDNDDDASDDNSDDDLDGYRDDFDLSSSSSSTATTRTSSSGSVEEEEVEDRCYRKYNVSKTITIDDLLRKLNEYQDEVHHHHRGEGGGISDDDGGKGGSRTASMLYMDGLIVDNDHNILAAPTATTTKTGSCHHHHQNRISLQIESLPPTILKVQTFEDFKANVFVGIPLVLETRVLHSSRKRPLIVWFVNNDIVSFDCNSYTPTMDDIGKQISVYVMPLHLHDDDNGSSSRCGRCDNGNDDGGCGTTDIVDRFLTSHQNVVYEVYQYENLVERRPNLPIIDRRLAWLPRSSSSSSSQPRPTNNGNNKNNVLRVMSYNLLADEYCKREVDKQLMYGHCQEQDIVKTRRMPLLVYEILIHQPDIVCLQEVDADVYKRLLFPVLKSQGYNGYYSPKVSAQLEGCAMFWNLNVFQKEPIRQEQFALRDLVKNSNKKSENDDGRNDDDSTTWTSTKDIHRLLHLKPDLQKVVNEKIGQVFQVASLRLKDPSWETMDEKKNRVVVVGNTHLFYHPWAHHIRLIQMYVICMQIDRSRRQAAIDTASAPSMTIRPTTTTSSLPPFIICGDMNSDPLSGCVRLLMNRMVESYHLETWKFLHEYSWEQGEEEFLLEHGFIGNDVGDEPVYQDEAFCDAVDDDIGITTNSANLEDNEKKEQQQQREEEVDSSLLASSSLPQPLQPELSDIKPPMIVLPATFPEIELGYEVIPEFTNYAVDFAETLDYIFASKPSTDSSGFELLSSASVPSKREMGELCVAMPNANMPSDHVSIACDFKWVVDE